MPKPVTGEGSVEDASRHGRSHRLTDEAIAAGAAECAPEATLGFGAPRTGKSATPLLTIKEFAALAGISAMTVYRLIHSGDFPAVRIGRRLFVPARLMDDLGDAALTHSRVVTAADWQEARE